MASVTILTRKVDEMGKVVRYMLAALLGLYVWNTMRRIEGIPEELTNLLILFLMVGAFVVLFVGAFKACWTGVTKEPDPPAKGGKKKKK